MAQAELMWLTGRLRPDDKTIADFCRDNGQVIQGACRYFVFLCRQVGLFCWKTRTLTCVFGFGSILL